MQDIKYNLGISGEVSIYNGIPDFVSKEYITKNSLGLFTNKKVSTLLYKNNKILNNGRLALVRKIFGVDVSSELGNITTLNVGDGWCSFDANSDPIPTIGFVVDEEDTSLNHKVFEQVLVDEPNDGINSIPYQDPDTVDNVWCKRVYAVLKSFDLSSEDDNDWSVNNSQRFISELGISDGNENYFAKVYFSPYAFPKNNDDVLTVSWVFKIQ